MDKKLESVKVYWETLSSAVSDQFKDHWVDDVGNPIEDRMFDEIADYIRKLLPNASGPLKILEVGCGTGRVLEKLYEANHEIELYGLDFSSSQINAAQRRLEDKAKLFVGEVGDFLNALHMQTSDNNFDLIFTHGVTQYFPGDDYFETFLNTCYELLSEGGSVLLIDAPIDWYKELMQKGSDSRLYTAKQFLKSIIPYRKSKIKERIGGVEFTTPVFEGYWISTEIAERCAGANYEKLVMEFQPFKSKPISYRRFRPILIFKRKLVHDASMELT